MKKPVFLITLLALHLLLLLNVRFTAWPEMLSYPYLFSNGFKLYTDFVYPYPPLLTILLTGFYKVLGFNIVSLKVVSWLFVLGADVFLFSIAKKILKKETTSFLLLVPYIFLQSFLDGNMLWFDNALILPLAGSFYFLLNWLKTQKPLNLLWTSLFLTIGVFIKQTAVIYFIVFFVFYFWYRRKVIWSEIIKILLPPALFGGALLTYLFLEGTLRDFWLWSLYYPLTFWSKFPGYQDLALNSQERRVFVLSLVPLSGAFLVWKKIIKDKVFGVAFVFLLASILAVYPRFTYFHLQPVLATIFIVFGVIYVYLRKYWYFIFLALVAALAVYPTLNYSFIKSVRFYDEEDQKLINVISTLSTKEEKVSLVAISSSALFLPIDFPQSPGQIISVGTLRSPDGKNIPLKDLRRTRQIRFFIKFLSGQIGLTSGFTGHRNWWII